MLMAPAMAASVPENGMKNAVFCRWLQQTWVGYACDGPIEQWLWRMFQWSISGGRVKDCDTFCFSQRKKGGACRSPATDSSSWCPRGQRCVCNN
ncbi:hypothetical protein BV898_08477 [Hypsibius exemplaris]|uniref:Uncharacterized protein n=1 Tax=Hypsibius exemplaris TaxID=2072580 RepID=A0A1W0WQA4_HYPEX|nr:hypothetical protein BV898_08477 [Hypsibius exemplaris]